MSWVADVSPLGNQVFVAASGNRCEFVELEEGALRAIWESDPSSEEISECNRWVARVLNSSIHSSRGLLAEAIALEAFRQLKREKP